MKDDYEKRSGTPPEAVTGADTASRKIRKLKSDGKSICRGMAKQLNIRKPKQFSHDASGGILSDCIVWKLENYGSLADPGSKL